MVISVKAEMQGGWISFWMKCVWVTPIFGFFPSMFSDPPKVQIPVPVANFAWFSGVCNIPKPACIIAYFSLLVWVNTWAQAAGLEALLDLQRVLKGSHTDLNVHFSDSWALILSNAKIPANIAKSWLNFWAKIYFFWSWVLVLVEIEKAR